MEQIHHLETCFAKLTAVIVLVPTCEVYFGIWSDYRTSELGKMQPPFALLSGELAHCKSDRLHHADLVVLLMSQVGGYANLYAITDYFT